MEGTPTPFDERVRAQAEMARKERAFSALLVARLAYLSVGFVMTALTLWVAAFLGPALAGKYRIAPFIPFVFAAMSFLGAFFVVRQPFGWALGLGLIWLLPLIRILQGAPHSPAHVAGLVGVFLGGAWIFRVRATLLAHPTIWKAMLAPDAPAADLRTDAVRRWQRIVLGAGISVALGSGGYAWATTPFRSHEADYESRAREFEVSTRFPETWNSADPRAIASWFGAEARDRIADGLPARVREAGFVEGWPSIGAAAADRTGKSMTVDFPILSSGRATRLRTDWEWRDGRWTLVRFDFARGAR
jgi:hypothetical protein